MADEVFKKYDVNNDGKLSTKELAAALKDMEVSANPDLLQAIVAQYDKDPKNGFLELTEFESLVSDLKAIKTTKREEVLDTFTAFDKDKSGFIESDELKEVLKALNMACDDETVKAMMACADTNNDDKVSITEFAKILGHDAE